MVRELYSKDNSNYATILQGQDAQDIIDMDYQHWVNMYNCGDLTAEQFKSYASVTTEYNIQLMFG